MVHFGGNGDFMVEVSDSVLDGGLLLDFPVGLLVEFLVSIGVEFLFFPGGQH
jgi:hypothetical protein